MIVQFRWIFFSLFVAIVSGLSFLAYRNGLFSSVHFVQENRGPFYMVYQLHRGPYHEILNTLTPLEENLKKFGFACEVTFGEFLDDPNSMEPERLSSNVGCIFDKTKFEQVQKTWNQLKQDKVKDSQSDSKNEKHLEFKILQSKKYLIGTFNGSPALGPYKVYSKVSEVLLSEKKQQSGPPIEVYTQTAEGFRTEYLFGLE